MVLFHMKSILKKSQLGINEDNISDILAGVCLNTSFKQTGKKGSISLDRWLPVNQKPQAILLGKSYDDMTDTEKKEVEAYKISQKIRQTLVSFIPQKDIKDIEAIEQQNLRKYKELSLGNNIMTNGQYDIFKNFLKVQDVKKMAIVDKIYNDWDSIIAKFIEDVKVKYPYIDENLIIDVANKKLGTAQEFKDSYKTILKFMPLPSVSSAALLPGLLAAEAAVNANESAALELEEAIGSNMNALYQAFNKIILSNNNISSIGGRGTVAPKTKGTAANAISLAKANLSFLKIDELDLLLNNIENIINAKDDKALVDSSESTLYDIYDFLNANSLLEYLDLTDSVIPENMLKNQYIVASATPAVNITLNSVADDSIEEIDESVESAEEIADEEVYW